MFSKPKSQILGAGLGAMAVLLASSFLSNSGQAQTAEKQGKDLFEKRCGGCHALDRDKEGPRLGGVYGRAAAPVGGLGEAEPARPLQGRSRPCAVCSLLNNSLRLTSFV